MSSPERRQNQKQCLVDGVFVTARKRPYREFVFDVEKNEDGEPRKRNPGRRGPLNDSTIQGIEAVKEKGGACWRCKMLKKPCDPGSPCKQCKTKSGKLWNIGCRRGSLHHLLDGIDDYILGLGSPEWFLLLEHRGFFRVRITSKSPEDELCDLGFSTLWTTPDSHSADVLLLRKFLDQFRDIRRYFPEQIPSRLSTVIRQCTKIQWDLVSHSCTQTSKWPESTLLIALTLRILAYALKYQQITSGINIIHRSGSMYVPTIINDKSTTIEVLGLASAPKMDSIKLREVSGVKLQSTIQEIIKIMQRVLLKRCPSDWPNLLCVLILLESVTFTLVPKLGSVISSRHLHSGSIGLVDNLSELYSISTKGVHPFAKNGASRAYALLVGDNQLAITHFNLLNDIWTSMPDHTAWEAGKLRDRLYAIVNYKRVLATETQMHHDYHKKA